jgi:hypothetical protein
MVANQLKPVIKKAKKKAAMNLKEDIFLNRPNTKNTVTVSPTNIKAAGPLVNKATPKKKPDMMAVLYPNFPTGLLVCCIK